MDSKDRRAALLQQAFALKKETPRTRPAGIPPRPEDEPARLGEFQRALWLQHRLAPDSSAYNLVSAFRLPRGIDVRRLENGLRAAVRRHRILRSTFSSDGDSVLQIIHDDLPGGFALQRIQCPPGDLTARAEQEARRPFDLGKGPLLRAFLVDEGTSRAVVVVLHHILADERSLLYMWEQIASTYNGEKPGASVLVQYDDFVCRQASEGAGARAADLEFWRDRLTPPPGDLALPFRRSPGGSRSSSGRLILRSAQPELSSAVQRLAASARSSTFGVYAFAFRLLLEQTAGGDDWAYATPVSRRLNTDTARMIGYFLNPVVVPSPVDKQVSVGDSIAANATELRTLMSRASVPFDELAHQLAPARHSGRMPLVQTMFVHQEEHAPPVLDGLQLEPLTLDLGEAKLDLTFFVSEGENSLRFGVEFRTEVYDQHWMERLARRYETLLASLTQNPALRSDEIRYLPAQEAAELRSWSLGEPLRKPQDTLVPRRILEQTIKAPEATAIICDSATWTYEDLARESRRITAALAEHGIQPGDRVGVYLDRSPTMIAGVLGVLWNGSTYVPLDPGYPPDHVSSVLRDADAKGLVTTRTLHARLPQGAPTPVLVDELEGAEGDFVEAAGSNPAYVLYTSGSTGEPKGVVVDHFNLLASTAAREQYYDVPPGRFLLLPSLAFDSSVAGLFWTLSNGGALVIPTGQQVRDPRGLADLIERRRVDSLLCVPSLYRHIVSESAHADQPTVLDSLTTVIVAGEACPAGLSAEHFRLLPDTRLFNEYGPTEASVWATVDELHAPTGDGSVSIGKPIPGVSVEVLDPHGRPTPPGIPGEGWIHGPTVAQGYWRRPELSAARFVERDNQDGTPSRAYRTGDRLAWTADGRLAFQGRIDNQIKLRGFRIEPEEIEAVLEERPGVAEAVVVLRSLGASDGLVAFVRTLEPVEGLREHLSARLPEHMIPGRIVEAEDLPRLANGKADRRRLTEIELAPPTARSPRKKVLSERKHSLVSLWQGLLGVSDVNVEDNFFQLGGHSLLMVQMAAALEREFGVEISPGELFQHPTIDEIDRLLDERTNADSPRYRHLFPLQPTGEGPPLIFCIPHFFADIYSQHFRGVRPVYGLRGVGIRPGGNRGLWSSMGALAQELADETLARFPDEPEFSVAGYSFGASMAFELVRILELRGVVVRDLQLIAPMPLDFHRFGPFRVQLDELRKPSAEFGPGEALRRLLSDNAPWKARPYRRLWRLLFVQNHRRLLCFGGDLRKRRGQPLTARTLHADVRLERFRLHSHYEPGVVQAPTVLFNAREPKTDAAATWRPHFVGPLEVVEIADPHLDAQAVEDAKARILRHLREGGDL